MEGCNVQRSKLSLGLSMEARTRGRCIETSKDVGSLNSAV